MTSAEAERERERRRAAEATVAQLESRLLETEQRLARIGDLELELRAVTTDYHLALELARHERDQALELLDRARHVQEDLQSSLSWRVTAPLRAAKRRRR